MTAGNLRLHSCWSCGVVEDLATSTAGVPVRVAPGDVGLCVVCGEWLVVDATGEATRRPTGQEFLEIGLSGECQRLRLAWSRRHPGGGLSGRERWRFL